MRVVFVPHAYHPSIGGAEEYTRGLAESIAGHGWEVVVVAPDVDDPEAFYELGHQRSGGGLDSLNGVRIERLPFISFLYRVAPHGFRRRAIESAVYRYSRSLRQALEELEPDAVVTLPHLFPNVEASFRIGRDMGWPLVYAPMLHEHDPNWSIDRVAPYVRAARGVIALTSHERGRLLGAYGAGDQTTVVVPPGTEVSDSVDEASREPIVLFVGRRAPSKRLAVLLDAMEVVWARHPETRLVVAGPAGPASQDLDARLLAHPQVEMTGPVDDEAKRSLYLRASAVVNPSLTESFGITTLESWAHGTPIVVPHTPINMSIVNDGVDGLVTGHDAASIAEGIAALLGDPDRARQLGRAGWSRVSNEFSWQRSGATLMSLIERL